MRLQINTSGKWRTVLECKNSRRGQVEDAAASLSRAAGGLRLRMVDDDGTVRHMSAHGGFYLEGEAHISKGV